MLLSFRCLRADLLALELPESGNSFSVFRHCYSFSVGFFVIKSFAFSARLVQHAVPRRFTVKLLLSAFNLLVSFWYYLVSVLQQTANNPSSKHRTDTRDVTHSPSVIFTVVSFTISRFLSGLAVLVVERVSSVSRSCCPFWTLSALYPWGSLCTLLERWSLHFCTDLMMLLTLFSITCLIIMQ